jgi:hypothetical protein
LNALALPPRRSIFDPVERHLEISRHSGVFQESPNRAENRLGFLFMHRVEPGCENKYLQERKKNNPTSAGGHVLSSLDAVP